MKIKGVDSNKLGRITGRRVGSAGALERYAAQSAPKSRKDDVEVSPGARLISGASERAQSAPDIRLEVVEPIREALAAGRYSVSNLDVADKILRRVLSEGKRSI
ncbi:MAG: flagellar biosynthesis anti-sigma factor FlgM [Magnetococcales bacterium]|nr:flagellar biosynthesis anti-sigma factor FlgM [Magnetococcales bacterium]